MTIDGGGPTWARDVVYLDFDGVLHGDDVYQDLRGRVYLRGHGELYEHAHVLIDALAGYPAARIVLSTSWVRVKGYGWTLKHMPEALRRRVVGATWHSNIDKDDGEKLWWRAASRYQQIARDVRVRKPARWLAIDDDIDGWPPAERSHVVACAPAVGLGSPDARVRLDAALAALCSETKHEG